MISEARIIINPRCKHLIYQLKNLKWDKNHKSFVRIKDSRDGELRGGHGDLVDALLFLVRNVVQSKNPFPIGYGGVTGPGTFSSHKQETNPFIDLMKGMFNSKK